MKDNVYMTVDARAISHICEYSWRSIIWRMNVRIYVRIVTTVFWNYITKEFCYVTEGIEFWEKSRETMMKKNVCKNYCN